MSVSPVRACARPKLIVQLNISSLSRAKQTVVTIEYLDNYTYIPLYLKTKRVPPQSLRSPTLPKLAILPTQSCSTLPVPPILKGYTLLPSEDGTEHTASWLYYSKVTLS